MSYAISREIAWPLDLGLDGVHGVCKVAILKINMGVLVKKCTWRYHQRSFIKRNKKNSQKDLIFREE